VQRIRFGLDLDGERGWHARDALGESTLGPLGFLNVLETQLGLTRAVPSAAARIVQMRWARGDDSGPTPRIGIAYGFNLAGGVTLDHLKCQVFEWLGNVQKFYDKAREEELDFGEPDADAPVSGMVH
jgi:hypothetical protein